MNTPPLSIVQHIFHRLQQESIRYCHWKSNEHVDAAVHGKTDLDVLVEANQKDKLQQILVEGGFKYFEAVPYRRYLDIDDYLAIDQETGVLVHLHLHYKLEIGEKQLKGYHLPWEDLILSSCIYDSEHHLYIAEPNIEIILLIVRAALKVRTRDRLKNLMGADYFKGDFIREFRWLKQRLDLEYVERLSKELLGTDAAQLVLEMINSESALHQLLHPKNPIYAALQPYRHYHPLTALRLRWSREFQNLFYRLWRKSLNAPIATRRTSVQDGLIIAILGADGSGKSTVKAGIVKDLSQKLDVLPIYLGSGDGSASLLRLPLIWAVNLAKGLGLQRKKASGSARSQSDGEALSSPKSVSLFKILWAITLVYEKQNKLKQAYLARQRGLIVITDRYPQSQILGFNDGPLLSKATSRLPGFAALQKWEFNCYQRLAEKMPPDLVIKLNVPSDVALARKPESPPEAVQRKVAAVQALQFPEQTNVVEIDATQPLQDVLIEAKWAIWQNL